jgi:CMP-N,N'-diacetyllegionaminic acid synthase
MIVAIITARANSKGLPGKNLLDLGGKPLIQHSFDVAFESGVFDRIILSTDSKEAIELAKSQKGIDVPFVRPHDLCDDKTSQVEVINHVLEFLNTENFEITHFVLFQPTVPFRKVSEIREGVSLLKSGSKSVIGVTSVMHHPADYLIRTKENKISYLMPEFLSKNRQSFPPVYFNNGGFYGCEVNFFKENQAFYNHESSILMMGEETLIDIDTEFDMKLAKGLMNYKN